MPAATTTASDAETPAALLVDALSVTHLVLSVKAVVPAGQAVHVVAVPADGA
jgi:hypothetical protein